VPGELTRKAVFAQPEWLRGVPDRVGDRRLPDGRVVFTGCGTSFHAAQTGGEAVQALEAVRSPPDADLLAVIRPVGRAAPALEAAKAFAGPGRRCTRPGRRARPRDGRRVERGTPVNGSPVAGVTFTAY